MVRYSLLPVLFLLSSFGPLRAQEVTFTAKVDSNNILIGDWLNLRLEVRHAPGLNVQLDAVPDSLAGFEILRRDTLLRKSTDREVVESATWTITSYDSGTFVVPPLRVRWKENGDTSSHFAESSPLPVFVHGLGVDTSQAIKDIKPPLSPGISFAEILPYIIAIVAIALISWLIYYFMKKRKRGERLIPEPPARPAHELAMDELRSLESEKYWQRGKVKEYHSKLTDIVRLYIERRFGIMALEMITDDILDAPGVKGLDAGARNPLKELLMLADLVKFAKLQPLAEENERSMKGAYAFVELTAMSAARRKPEAVPQEANA